MQLLALAAKCWQTALSAMLFAMSTERPSRLLVGRVFIVIRLHVARAAEVVACSKAKGWKIPPFFVCFSFKITIDLHRNLEFFSHSWPRLGLYRFLQR